MLVCGFQFIPINVFIGCLTFLASHDHFVFLLSTYFCIFSGAFFHGSGWLSDLKHHPFLLVYPSQWLRRRKARHMSTMLSTFHLRTPRSHKINLILYQKSDICCCRLVDDQSLVKKETFSPEQCELSVSCCCSVLHSGTIQGEGYVCFKSPQMIPNFRQSVIFLLPHFVH